MQKPGLSLHSVLEALELEPTGISVLEQAEVYQQLVQSTTPEEIYAAIRTVGQLVDADEKANQLADGLEERINIIIHKLKFIPKEQRPTVACLQDISTATNINEQYLASLIDIAGGVSLVGGEAYATENPDILLVIDDLPVPQLLAELAYLLTSDNWTEINAVKSGQVYVVHDARYLRRPSALVAEDVEILAEIINPKHFIFGREADAWMRFNL